MYLPQFPNLVSIRARLIKRVTHNGTGKTSEHVTCTPSLTYNKKAQKSLAARNVAILTRMHMSMAAVHSFFLICHFFFRRSLLAWFLISLPSIGVEIWFERISRPTYTGDGIVKELRRAGEDLEAKGLTEWMWDVVYWTWGCVLLAGVLGNRAFWLYVSAATVYQRVFD